MKGKDHSKRNKVLFHTWINDYGDGSTTKFPGNQPVAVELPFSTNKLAGFSQQEVDGNGLRNDEQDGVQSNSEQDGVQHDGGQRLRSNDSIIDNNVNNGEFSDVTSPEKNLHRTKRNNSVLGRRLVKKSLTCKQCAKLMKLDYSYDTVTAIYSLRMSFSCTDTDGCCSHCRGTFDYVI